jgi:ribonuclease Z
MLADCISKRHSTFTEAAAEGRAMQAKFTMLTHFSQRYCKLPMLDEIEAETMNNLGIAFDGMAVRPSNFEYVRLMYPALKAIYAEAIRDMEIQQGKQSNKNYAEVIAESLSAEMGNGKSSGFVPKKKLKLDS